MAPPNTSRTLYIPWPRYPRLRRSPHYFSGSESPFRPFWALRPTTAFAWTLRASHETLPAGASRIADMEGPAVKRFVTAPSISWSMLTSEYLSGRHGRFPEDAGARLTMERLRRRIRLICAGCSEEQSRMTPLRRELPPSRGASRPDPETGRRIASARTLQSCSHRAVADAARESRSHYPRPLLASVTMVTRLGAGSRVESWRPR